ncbi:MAG TPA: phenylalanine--tRNA ligase subunit alpha [Gemmatimonadaceae bacterium]|nr:phenylalanine--tRNA ligase subunit alpha [Gemmatimonadaceae bacterium]
MTTLRDFLAAVGQLEADGLALIMGASSAIALEQVRTTVVGRKSGRLTELMKDLPSLPLEERREAGAALNRVKVALEEALATQTGKVVAAERSAGPRADLTLPARAQFTGAKHPVTLVIEEIAAIFRELGFTIAAGPEAETEWYNFTALNFPPDHPALDAHDTLYLGDGMLLRTHTSPVQIRTMQTYAPPIRVLIPGNVYRLDPFDASHAPMFAQIEGLAVDEGVSFVDLKATLSHFANRFFGKTRTRFRPSYFPFTEPSAEMDVECQLCHGSGCPGCKGTGWMEILGAGMVHPNVFDAAGIDSERYTGWAFGMGPARIAQQRYGIPDIRLLYDSDVRFLGQVAR